MPSIFENQYKDAETWDMQGAVILFTNGDSTLGITGAATETSRASKLASAAAPLIVQSLSLTFGRTVSQIYPINISQAIQLLGIPQGQLQIGILWGPNDAFKQFVTAYNSTCAKNDTGKAIKIIPYGKVCQNDKFVAWNNTGSLLVKSPILSSLGVTIQSATGNAMPVNASVTMSFVDLEVN